MQVGTVQRSVCQISSRADENALNRWKKSVNIHYRLDTQLYTFGP